jgi:hypothetical protein
LFVLMLFKARVGYPVNRLFLVLFNLIVGGKGALRLTGGTIPLPRGVPKLKFQPISDIWSPSHSQSTQSVDENASEDC